MPSSSINLKKGSKTDRITGHGSTTTEPPTKKEDCICRSRRLDTNMFIKLNIVPSCFTRKYLQTNCVPCECYKCGTTWVDKVLPTDPPKTKVISIKTEIMCCIGAKSTANECQHAYCGKCYYELLCDHEGDDGKEEPTIITVKQKRSRG